MNSKVLAAILTVVFVVSCFGNEQKQKFSESIIGIYTNVDSNSEIAAAFEQEGFQTVAVGSKNIIDFCGSANKVLVIPPGEIVNPIDRPAINDLLKRGSGIMILNPNAFNYRDYTTSGPVKLKEKIVVLGKGLNEEYKIVKDDTSTINVRKCGADDGGAIILETEKQFGGSCFLEMNLNLQQEPTRYSIEVQAEGGPQFDLLAVKLVGPKGKWIGFAELTGKPGIYAISVADMLAEKGTSTPVQSLVAKDIEKVQIGIAKQVTWGEAGGAFKIGTVNLLLYDQPRYVKSGEIIKYRAQLLQTSEEYPDWIFDPMAVKNICDSHRASFVCPAFGITGDIELAGQVCSIGNSLKHIGGNPESLRDMLKRTAVRRIPLIQAVDKGKKVDIARLEVCSDGNYAGSWVGSFGFSGKDYQNQKIRELLTSIVKAMTSRPRILDAVAGVKKNSVSKGYDLLYKFQVFNPLSKAVFVEASVKIGNSLNSSRELIVEPQRLTEIAMNCGQVPADFNFTNFTIDASLHSADGNDGFTTNINIANTLNLLAEHFINAQAVNFCDSAYTHWFYLDSYAARFLRAFGEYSNNQNYINSAMRWGQMICTIQNPDGAIPMGYGMKTGMYFVADNGSISLALVQLATHANKYDRKAFIDAAKRNYEWRDTFKVTPERLKEIKTKFGENADGAEIGYYGIGMVDRDYISKKFKYEGIQPEYRGIWYTLACTMAFPAALAHLENSSGYMDSAQRDAAVYLDKQLTVTRSYAPEGLLWVYEYVDDKDIHEKIRGTLTGKFIKYFSSAAPKYWLQEGSRQSLLLAPLVHCMRNVENSSLTRAAVLEAVIGMCGDYSAYSVPRVAENYPKTTWTLANNDAFIYLSFSSIGLMELLKPDSTMLCKDSCWNN